MDNTNYLLFSTTPTVMVFDNRGLGIRELDYYRHPEKPNETDERITYHQFDVRGHLIQSIDPRLAEQRKTDDTVKANFYYLSSLNGEALRTDSVDAGTVVTLNDSANRPIKLISATGVVRTWQYEDNTLPGRLLSITEQALEEEERIKERFVWASNTQEEKDWNLVGSCIRHYDTVGLNQINSISLTGVPLSVTRQLLADETEANWQKEAESAWKNRLATDRYTTNSTVDSRGRVLTTTDAKGHQQRLADDIAGLLKGSWLTLKDDKEQIIVRSLTYSAAGQKLREEHGNGIVTTYTYEPETQRLIGIKTERPTGHKAGASVLQELHYGYDPVGNVVHITNTAEATGFWRNQKVVPESTYTYDSLYQLVKATGREQVNREVQDSRLPAIATLLPSNDNLFTAYTRYYDYDRGGNLTHVRHSAPATGNCYTTAITVSSHSNRAVQDTLTKDPRKVEALFDQGGHQLQLQPGQNLCWTARGELLDVTLVNRANQVGDQEIYRYDSGGQRVIKTSMQKTTTGIQMQRTLYLPGLELRTTINNAKEKERLHVITVTQASRALVRVLHWEQGKPNVLCNDQVRYSHNNLLGSSSLEVDGDGQLISAEEYYPYGGTAILAARSQIEVDYKTIRYSGKERDATGLYYYGYRYYQPWVGRWLSSDPSGTIDGLNLFKMVKNNPITLCDKDGLSPEVENKEENLSIFYLRGRNPLRKFLFYLTGGGEKRLPFIESNYNKIFNIYATRGKSLGFVSTTTNIDANELISFKNYIQQEGMGEITEPVSQNLGYITFRNVLKDYTRDSRPFEPFPRENILEDDSGRNMRNRGIEYLENALTRIKPIDAVAFRGTKIPKGTYGKQILEGDIVKNERFLSTSVFARIAIEFSTNGNLLPDHERILFLIRSKSGRFIGTDNIAHSDYIYQREILHFRDRNFLVNKIIQHSDDTKLVMLSEVEGPFVNFINGRKQILAKEMYNVSHHE